jgi:hypothetical protein
MVTYWLRQNFRNFATSLSVFAKVSQDWGGLLKNLHQKYLRIGF